jgi:hypothetical protein
MDAKLKTPSGWISANEARSGMELASVDEQSSFVQEVFSQGITTFYRVRFFDGRFLEVPGTQHWKVHFVHEYTEGSGAGIHNGWHTFTTDAIRTFCLNGSRRNGHRAVYVPLVNGDFGDDSSIPIDPWLLGVLIGDGGLTNGTPIVTSADQEIVDRVATAILPFGLHTERVTTNGEHRYGYRLSGHGFHRGNPNPLNAKLRDLGLIGLDSSQKFIPAPCLNAMKESRWELLRGLMDTDGTSGSNEEISYCTTSLQLAHDVQQLVWSLGGIANLGKPKAAWCTFKGERHYGKLAYIVLIHLPEREKAFTLTRKQVPKRKYQPRLRIETIEPVGQEESLHIAVSQPSKLVVMNDYIVTLS